jgi:cell division protein FtsN
MVKKERKEAGRSPLFWIAMIFILTGIILAAGFLAVQFKPVSQAASAVYARVNDWMHDRNARLQKNLVKVKQLAANDKDAHEEIHFEFYTVLPNMKVPVKSAEKSSAEGNAAAKMPAANKAPSIFDAGELQDALKEEVAVKEPVSSGKYIIQVGAFKNIAGAEKFCETFLTSGFSARITAAETAKGKIYNVQVGPFNTRDQAVLAERQLQKKNINGIIRSL